MKEENEQVGETKPAEEPERVVILECSLTFSLRDEAGSEKAAGEGQAQLDRDALSVQPKFGEALYFSLRDVLTLSEADFEVHLSLPDKEELVIRDLGYRHEDFLKNLSRQRSEVLLRDMLMDENLLDSGAEAELHYLNESGQEVEKGTCEPRLYETALVILPELGDPIRIPYSLTADVGAEDYVLAISTEFGEKIILSQMGGRFQPFCKRLSESISALSLKAQSILKELLPEASPAVIREAARLMKDGKAARKGDLDAIAPPLSAALESKMEAAGLKDSYSFLKSLSQHDDLFVGLKRGLLGDLTGEYIWFLIPFYGGDGKPANAIAMEAASDCGGGKATYFFRIVGRGYPNLNDPEDLRRRTAELIKQMNRCLITVNFRREPIYLAEDELNTPRYSRYRFAIQKLPPLQMLRRHFIGRVIHLSPEQWEKDVADLLNFNTAVGDDSAKWTKGRGEGEAT